MLYRTLIPLLALGLVACSNPTTDFHACRYDSKKTVLLVDLKRDFRALGLGEYDEEIEENLVLLCMKARKWVWHPDKAIIFINTSSIFSNGRWRTNHITAVFD